RRGHLPARRRRPRRRSAARDHGRAAGRQRLRPRRRTRPGRPPRRPRRRRRMITVRAPGKLFVAGEYAAVEPGEPAVIIAVDRYLAVTLTESVDVGTVHSPEYGQLPLV